MTPSPEKCNSIARCSFLSVIFIATTPQATVQSGLAVISKNRRRGQCQRYSSVILAHFKAKVRKK